MERGAKSANTIFKSLIAITPLFVGPNAMSDSEMPETVVTFGIVNSEFATYRKMRHGPQRADRRVAQIERRCGAKRAMPSSCSGAGGKCSRNPLDPVTKRNASSQIS